MKGKLLFLLSIAFINCYGDSITGNVMSTDKKPLSGASISIFKFPDTHSSVKTTISDKNGRFRFDNLETGYYRIIVSKKSFCNEVLGRIEVNQPKFGIVNYEIVLARPGSISGFIYNPEGRPVSGADVFCGDKQVKTDTKGFYRIEGLKPGTYYISTRAPDFVSECRPSVTVDEQKETGGVDFILSYAGKTKGVIVDSGTGKPIKDVQVSCSGPVYISGKTDSNGLFIIDGLKPGSYSMYFYRQGYEYFETGFSVLARQVLDIGTIKLKLRDRYFYPVLREWIFTPQENVRIYFNAFRIPSVTVDIYEVDIMDQINRAKLKEISMQDILGSLDISSKKPVLSKKFDISYPNPLSELYDRKITIGPMSEGLYICKIKPDEFPEKRLWFLVSDIGFVSKSCNDKMDCTVFSISKGNIIENVPVYIFDRQWNLKNEIKTSQDGKFSVDGSNRFLILHGKSIAFSDTSYIFAGREGDSRSLYAFTDRPVYRPGQNVYFKGIARIDQGNNYNIPEFSDCSVKILSPDGSTVYETMIKPTKTGSVYGEWKIPDEPPLGIYTIEFLTEGKNQLEGRCVFKVLEYRKPEFYIEAKPDKLMYLPGEKIRVGVLAKYYFGAPVKNVDVMWAVYSRDAYNYEDNEGEYEYGGWWRGSLISSGITKTDENGSAQIEISAKPSYQQKEIYTIEIRMTDLSRREITTSSQVVVLPGCFEILLSTDRFIYFPQEEIPITISVRYFFDNQVSEKHQMTVSVNQETYDPKKRRWNFKEILSKKFTLEGEKTTIKLKPSATGYIKISVHGIDRYHNIITGTRYVWVAGKDDYTYWYPKKEIEVVLDKTQYRVGDVAKILINSSKRDIDFLFTIEGQKLFESRIIRMKNNSILIEIPIKEEYIPNVYVSVCGVSDKNFINAAKQLKIESKDKFLNVEILPEKKEFQPGESAHYTIKTTDYKGNPVSAEFSLGVVDESIYAISKELVSEIEDFFYGSKGNRVSTSYSFYRWYYGGAGKDFSQAEIRKKFKDTAFWLPVAFTDRDGTAEIKFEFPDNLTTWRATVRAITIDTKVGTGISKVITTKPLIATLITPRFLVEDDRLLISGVIHNQTGSHQKIYVKLNADGLYILDEQEKSIELDSGKSGRIDWKVKVNSTNKAAIVLAARASHYKDGMELVLPVFAYGVDERYVFAGRCDDSKTDTFYMPAGAITASIDAKSYIYPSLASGLFSSLDELADYPYGCVEQTLNAFLPAIQVAHTLTVIKDKDLYLLVKDRKKFEEMIVNLPKKVSDGLIKLYNYQREDGGWGWWQNDSSNPYTTAYVVFGFAHAKKSGYFVNGERFERAKNFLKNKISSTADYNQKAFMLYALSYAGEKDVSSIEDIYRNREKLNPYTLAQLCLILKENGDPRVNELLDYLCGKLIKPSASLCYWQAEDGNYSWINHNIEATAWGLRAILAVDPKRSEIPGILRYLTMKKQGGLWLSTKDTAICLFALTDFLKTTEELSPDYDVSFYVNDSLITKEKIDKRNIEKFITTVRVPDENFVPGKINTLGIRKQGAGNLYYSHVIKYTVKDVFIPAFEEAGFKVSRRYTEIEPREIIDKDGNRSYVYDEIKRGVKSGERIRVEIRISGQPKYEYIMIEDPIPAGFEVVDEPWQEYYWYCRKEVRDEKVAFFTPVWGEDERTIVYQLRAETPGVYHILPTKVQLMYLPEIWGRSQGNILFVE
ncbi:MAG: carboxypeptidase regulatory-like domain-containing protein [bacterium]|nr:carboxypeptidase regulatory-like domain-containing protein [bacterium]